MRCAFVAPVILAVLAAVHAGAFEVNVSSDPPGAVVWAAPADHPVLYKKGLTPCRISLGGASAPVRLVLRKAGHFEAFRTVTDGTAAVSVTLVSRDDPAAWQNMRWAELSHRDQRPWRTTWGLGAGQGPPREIAGLAPFLDRCYCWAPDASGLLATGNEVGDGAYRLGIVPRNEDRDLSDLWYVPWEGAPVLVWRCIGEPDAISNFQINPDFSPDGRWIAHSSPTGDKEHIRLYCIATGKGRDIATDEDFTIFHPRFSSSGRLIACVREWYNEDDYEEEESEPPPDLQVMRFDGSGRRTVATGLDPDWAPVFSPDESQVAFVTAEGQAAVVPVSGGEPRVLLDEPSWPVSDVPMWSPDGKRLAVNCRPGSRSEQAPRKRAFWVEVETGRTGFLRGCEALGWHDADSLLVPAIRHLPETGDAVIDLIVAGIDGEKRAVLLENMPCDPSGLALTVPSEGDAK